MLMEYYHREEYRQKLITFDLNEKTLKITATNTYFYLGR